MTLFYPNPPQNVVLLCCHGSDCLRHVMKGVKKTDWKEWRRRWIHELSLISVQTTVLSRIPFLKEELGASSFHSFEVTCLERCIPCVRWKEGIWAWKSETLKDMEAEEWAVTCKSWQSRGVPGSFKKFWKDMHCSCISLIGCSPCSTSRAAFSRFLIIPFVEEESKKQVHYLVWTPCPSTSVVTSVLYSHSCFTHRLSISPHLMSLEKVWERIWRRRQSCAWETWEMLLKKCSSNLFFFSSI